MPELKKRQNLVEASEMKWMDVKEFRDLGYLQELNRLFLHPLGLALAVSHLADGIVRLHGIIDCRDDPEGIRFAEQTPQMVEHALTIGREQRKRFLDRKKALGYVIQPLSVTLDGDYLDPA